MHRNCIIDNWSLEQASTLLSDNFHEKVFLTDIEFVNTLGGLSNYINAILLYDTPQYVANGFESEWKSRDWFEQNTCLFIQEINPQNVVKDWNNEESYRNHGVKNYLLMSEFHQSDLFVSSQRASEILKHRAPSVDDNFLSALNKIDEMLKKEAENIWLSSTKIGIDKNFHFPSLMQYVLSQAKNHKDLFTVIMQIKASGQIDALRLKIDDIARSAKSAMKFQKQVDELINISLDKDVKSKNVVSIKIPVAFLTFTRNVGVHFFRTKKHLVFLKNIIACRTEADKAGKDIERIFQKKISL